MTAPSAQDGWKWIWPGHGSLPLHQGLDSEAFDSPRFPYNETFVREAIQNSLDARYDNDAPVRVSFKFHSENIGSRGPFLEQLMEHRKTAGLDIPQAWYEDKVTWLLVEDRNTKGLQGDLGDRESDFWNYWLNFGISNKDGTDRGGRGIGRVTFLIASSIKSVIGYTRRQGEGKPIACGMAVLKAKKVKGRWKSTHAYLVDSPDNDNDIYHLHKTGEFLEKTGDAFQFDKFGGTDKSGFGLAVLYPHEKLKRAGIMAAVIENFAPAILNGSLAIDVDDMSLDRSSIFDLAQNKDITDELNNQAMKDNVKRYLTLVKDALQKDKEPGITTTNTKGDCFEKLREDENVKKISEKIRNGETCSFDFTFPLAIKGREEQVSLTAIIGKSLPGEKSIDRLFREGMSLPYVTTTKTAGFDLVVLIEKGNLATYLNFCEGKAHLDIVHSEEIRENLRKNNFESKTWNVQRLVKTFPEKIRNLMQPDITEPDTTTFAEFFPRPSEKPGRKKKPTENIPPVDPPPPPKTKSFNVLPLEDGIRIEANPEYDGEPLTVTIMMAYANGEIALNWSKYDFLPKDLSVESKNCEISFENNIIEVTECGPETSITIRGFDTNRELDTRIRESRNAHQDQDDQS